jgi:hypothetical protein
MFASLGLYHFPEIEKHRPASVVDSWTNQTKRFFAETELPSNDTSGGLTDAFSSQTGQTVDVSAFRLFNCTLTSSGSSVLFQVHDANVGYALRKSSTPIQKGSFKFSLKRAPGPQGQGRHGNAYFVFGPSEDPKACIECRLYYGGRSSMMITGSPVQTVEKKLTFARRDVFTAIVTVDCKRREITFEVAGHKLTALMQDPLEAVNHYGYGGGNSANLCTGIAVESEAPGSAHTE